MTRTILPLLGFVFGLGCGVTFGRPISYDILQLIERSPIVVKARVASKVDGLATVVVEKTLKGGIVGPTLSLRDIPRRLPRTPGLSLSKGEAVLLFLSKPDRYFALHQSKITLKDEKILDRFVASYVLLIDKKPENDASAKAFFKRQCGRADKLTSLEKAFLLRLLSRSKLELATETIHGILATAATDRDAKVRWEALRTARELRFVREHASRFLSGLSDPDRRVRALSFDTLRSLAEDDRGYDIRVPPDKQKQAIQSWRKWVQENLPEKDRR